MPVEKQFTIAETQLVEVLVSSVTSNGAMSILINHSEPGDGPPPHTHTLEDEFFVPLEGQFELFDGNSWKPLEANGTYAQRGKLHTWRNSGTTHGRLLVVATGGSFDVFLEKFAAMRIPDQMAEVISMSAQHGITYALPQQN